MNSYNLFPSEARDQWEMEKDKLMKCMFELRSEKLRLEEDYEVCGG